MNILFLLKSLGVGGVEVVTVTLANKFVEEGHNVTIYARCEREKTLHDRLSSKIKVYMGHGENVGRKNVDALHKVYVDEDIDVVINQWGLSYQPAMLARRAEKGYQVKIVSFYHNDPSTNGKLQNIDLAIEACKSNIKKPLLKAKRAIAKLITSKSMKYTYDHSDRFMVLSPSYIKNLQDFIGIDVEAKQGVLTNPVTIDCSAYNYACNDKQKEVIYCGRVDYTQKRVYRLINAWTLIEKDFPDWKLTIVGDGVARKEVEEQVLKLALKNVHFEGFQQPLEYYKRASILALTSEYEGFPLVLAECMSFGVVPVVYDSFSAVHDIINDGVNGAIVPKVNDGFNQKLFAEKLRAIMKDVDHRDAMAHQAIETSKAYSIDNIYKEWEKVFAIV